VIFALLQPVSCIALWEGERKTPVLVRLKLLEGGYGIHKMVNNLLARPHVALRGVSKSRQMARFGVVAAR
jgi:hypothetical protein